MVAVSITGSSYRSALRVYTRAAGLLGVRRPDRIGRVLAFALTHGGRRPLPVPFTWRRDGAPKRLRPSDTSARLRCAAERLDGGRAWIVVRRGTDPARGVYALVAPQRGKRCARGRFTVVAFGVGAPSDDLLEQLVLLGLSH